MISNQFPAYNRLTCRKQKCLLHLLREIKEISQTNEETRKFYKWTKRFIKDASHFKGEFHSPDEVAGERKRFEKRIDRVLKKSYTDPSCIRIVKRLRKHRNSLLTFIDNDGVDYHNNRAERAIRFMVVRRNISGGNRSWKGASYDEILMSVTMTHKLRKENFLAESAKFIRDKLSERATSKS